MGLKQSSPDCVDLKIRSFALKGITMKKASTLRKLALSKETLRKLHSPDLHHAVGQGWSDDSVCPSVNDTRCRCPP
jgi:hypothetical protein